MQKPSIFKLQDLYTFILGIMISTFLTIVIVNLKDIKISQLIISLITSFTFYMIYTIILIQRYVYQQKFCILNKFKILINFNGYNQTNLIDYEKIVEELINKYTYFFDIPKQQLIDKFNSQYYWVNFVNYIIPTFYGNATGITEGNEVIISYLMYDPTMNINPKYHINVNMPIESTSFSHEFEHLIINSYLGYMSNSHHELMNKAKNGEKYL